MDRDSRRVPNSQRARCYQKHRGWVRAKACGFCQRVCHVDEMGVQAPPWRVREVTGVPQQMSLTWYCCVQCAKHLDVSKPGWMFKAPYHVPNDCCVPDSVQGVAQRTQRTPKKPSAQAVAPVKMHTSWANDQEEITLGALSE